MNDRIEQHGFTRLTYQEDEAGNPNSVFIETLFGSCLVQEPLLLLLLKHPQMERLTRIHQHGHWHYLRRCDGYTRFEHSINVFVIVRLNGGSYEEQVAALLHDISHTIFSHTGPFCFTDQEAKADGYQDDNHVTFLKEHGFDILLEQYGLSIEKIHHKNEHFTVLEQALPGLCADRIEYNITGGLYKGLISFDEAKFILSSLVYKQGQWYFADKKAAVTFAQLPLFMTNYLWGGAIDAFTTYWLAKGLRRAIDLNLITREMVCDSTDEVVWHFLAASDDPLIIKCVDRIKHYERYLVCDEKTSDLVIMKKFRGVDPLVLCCNGELKRLTELDGNYKNAYESVKGVMAKGWHFCLRE